MRGNIDEWPERWTGLFIVYVAFAVFFFYTYANGGFHIEDTLFPDYYYVGRVKNGAAIGKGRQYDSVDFRLVYSGDFENNRRSGQGTFYYENGDRYKGQWANDKRNGVGIYYPKGGKSYRGEWVNDEFVTPSATESDSATPVLPDALIEANHTYENGDRYTGQWAHDMPQGQGTMYYSNGNRYEGEWLDGKFQGQGTYYFATGDRYEGDFVDSKLNGYGVLTWNNGDCYKGDFVDNKRNGYGVLTWNNGNRWTGPFVDDKAQGWGTYYYADGKVEKAEARDGTIYHS